MQQLSLRQRVWRYMPMIALALVLTLLWKSLLFKDQPMAKESTDHSIPKFSLTDVKSHKTYTQETLRGKTHIIQIWASWCGACVRENSTLVYLQEKWPVSLVGVLYRDEPKKALALLERKGDPYTVLLNDPSGKLGHALGIAGTPETFIVDATGKIRFHHSGALDKHAIKTQIIPMLEKIAHENVQ